MKTPFDYDKDCSDIVRPFYPEIKELVGKIMVKVVEGGQSMIFAEREISATVEYTEVLMRSYANLVMQKIKDSPLPNEEKFAYAINQAFDKMMRT